MFEHFTDSARHVVVVSQEVTRVLEHHEISTSHLLVALRQEPDLRLAAVWAGLDPAGSASEPGLTVAALGALVGSDGPLEVGFLPFSAAGKKAFENTLRAGLALGTSPPISPVELLIGVLDTPDEVTAGLLTAAGIDAATLRDRAVAAASSA